MTICTHSAVYAFLCCLTSVINLIGLGIALCPEDSRKKEVAHLREQMNLHEHADWQIIAMLILLAVCPYFNLALFPSLLATTCEQITEWIEPFGKKGE